MSRSYGRKTPSPQRIAIVRALPGLGDLLCAVPAFRALRTAFPQAQITLIGLPDARQFAERFGQYLDEWLAFPGYPGIPEGWQTPHRLPAFLAEVQKRSFDLAIQMHGSGIVSNPFTVLLGAKITAGFYLPEHYCPDPEYFLPYPEAEPEVRRHLQLMEFLGIPLQGEDLEFSLYDWELALEQIANFQLQRAKYVCIHPGASLVDRRWPPLQFARVADALSEMGYQVVLTGTAAEKDLAQTVVREMKSSVVDLTGQTTLGALGALLKGAALLICNDTGVSHLAAALKVKSVVIFSNSDPLRWAPLDHQRHRIISVINHHSSVLQPRSLKPENWPTAMDEQMLKAVLAEAKELLQQEAAYA